MKRGTRSCSPPLATRKRQAPEPFLSAPTLGPLASPQAVASARPLRPTVNQIEAREALGAAFVKEYKDELLGALTDSQDACWPDPRHLALQPYITCQQRLHLLNYLFPLFTLYNLSPTTVHLAISLLDRYSSSRIVHLCHYQLLGVVCLRIAAKYAEGRERIPFIDDCVVLCADAYSASLFRRMERAVLQTLEWRVGATTAMHFLELILAHASPPDADQAVAREIKRMGCMARMWLDVVALHVCFLQFQPETLAAAAWALSQQILVAGPATFSLLAETRQEDSSDASRELTTLLLDLGLQMPAALVEKYTTAQQCFVATRFQASEMAAEARVQATERYFQLEYAKNRHDLRPSSSPSPNGTRGCPSLSASLSSSMSSESSTSNRSMKPGHSIHVPAFYVTETGSPRPYTSTGAAGVYGDAKRKLTPRWHARSVTPEPIIVFQDV